MNKIDKNIVERIKKRISKKNPEAEIILFGSHARGQAHRDSDWDILILLDNPIVNRMIEKEYREEIFEVELETGEAISTLVLSKQDWMNKHYFTPLFKNIQKEGIQL